MGLYRVECTDVFGFYAGIKDISVHDEDKCAGKYCCIHNPSNHHMLGWRQLWRDDRKMMERICPHGVGHPDPDEISTDTIHGCCGCCIASTIVA